MGKMCKALPALALCGAVLGATGFSAREAAATVTTYYDLAAFLAAAGGLSIGLTLDSFDFAADGALVTTVNRTGYAITDNDSPPASLGEQDFSATCAGAVSPSTDCVVITIADGGVTFSFDSAINAFGVLIGKSTLATNFVSATLNGETVAGSFFADDDASVLLGFFGLIDDGATLGDVTIAGIPAGNLLGFDDVRFGAIPEDTGSDDVPAPATLVLLGAGLAGLGLGRRRRR